MEKHPICPRSASPAASLRRPPNPKAAAGRPKQTRAELIYFWLLKLSLPFSSLSSCSPKNRQKFRLAASITSNVLRPFATAKAWATCAWGWRISQPQRPPREGIALSPRPTGRGQGATPGHDTARAPCTGHRSRAAGGRPRRPSSMRIHVQEAYKTCVSHSHSRGMDRQDFRQFTEPSILRRPRPRHCARHADVRVGAPGQGRA